MSLQDWTRDFETQAYRQRNRVERLSAKSSRSNSGDQRSVDNTARAHGRATYLWPKCDIEMELRDIETMCDALSSIAWFLCVHESCTLTCTCEGAPDAGSAKARGEKAPKAIERHQVALVVEIDMRGARNDVQFLRF